MIRHPHHRPVSPDDGERGATLVVVALVMTSLLIMAALVVDLGFTRTGAGFDQSAADLAALAGGDSLARGKYEKACQEIITYVNLNAKGMPAINGTAFCGDFARTTCTGGTLTQATPSTRSGRYGIEMRFPVPDDEIRDPTFGVGLLDGLPCERITVTVTSDEPSFFGGIMGRDGYEIRRSATVRGGASQTRLVPALWLLDPVGCPVLTVQGGSKVTTGDTSDPNNIIPGVITLDSDASDSKCSTNNTALVVGGTGTELRAIPTTGPEGLRGQITLNALPFSATSCTGTKACNPSAVPSQVSPQPQPSNGRATRAPVDWVWNCKASYPTYLGIEIEGCPYTDTRAPYIDRLVSGVGSTGRPTTGYQRWRQFHSCNVSGQITVSGNWWIDCPPPNGMSISSGNSVTFTGGNLVFDGGIKLNGTGVLNVNTANPSTSMPSFCKPSTLALPCLDQSSSRAAFIYNRAGDWTLGGGTFNAVRTSLILAPSSFVSGTGGAPPRWTSPSEGPFQSLSLWAEASGSFNVAGGAGVSLQGTFFTPFADELTLTGGGNWGQQNAQFISYRLKVTGGSVLTMAPDPSSAVIMPPAASTLIR
jgi:hypothetical protein